jgi:hypothetical protein
MRHANRIFSAPYCIATCGLSAFTVFFFSTLSHKWHDSRKKTILNVKCLFWFSPQLLSETFPILRRIRPDIVTDVHRSSCEVLVILARLDETCFLDRFSKNPQIPIFLKIRLVVAEIFMRTDRRTETWRG